MRRASGSGCSTWLPWVLCHSSLSAFIRLHPHADSPRFSACPCFLTARSLLRHPRPHHGRAPAAEVARGCAGRHRRGGHQEWRGAKKDAAGRPLIGRLDHVGSYWRGRKRIKTGRGLTLIGCFPSRRNQVRAQCGSPRLFFPLPFHRFIEEDDPTDQPSALPSCPSQTVSGHAYTPAIGVPCPAPVAHQRDLRSRTLPRHCSRVAAERNHRHGGEVDQADQARVSLLRRARSRVRTIPALTVPACSPCRAISFPIEEAIVGKQSDVPEVDEEFRCQPFLSCPPPSSRLQLC